MKIITLILLCMFITACSTAPPGGEKPLTNADIQAANPINTPSPLPDKEIPASQTPTASNTTTPTEATGIFTATPTPASPIQPLTQEDGFAGREIRDLWVNPGGQLWVASEAGIDVHLEGGWEKRYSGPVVRLLGADADGRVWAILDGESAIAVYDSGDWRVYGPEQGWTTPSEVEYLSPGYGDGLISDAQNQVWLATGRDDLRRFDPQPGTWMSLDALAIGFDPAQEAGYQGHFLTDVELSKNQKVWVGNCIGIGEQLTGQGIRWSDGESWFEAPFTSGECVQDIEIDAAGRMWVGGFDALMQYDPSNGAWSRIPLPPWERRQLVSDITLDQKNNPWVEIIRYGGASPLGEVARYHLLYGEWVLDYEGWFSSLAFGEDGVAWVCGEGEVYRLQGGQAEGVGTVPGNQCQIVVDGDGHVWVTNYETLWWLDPGY